MIFTVILVDSERNNPIQIDIEERRFTITHDGHTYHHVGEDEQGRWIYAKG